MDEARPAPLHLLHVFSTFAVGGPQVRFATIAGRLGAVFRHTILAIDGNYDAARLLDSSAPVELRRVSFDKGRGMANAPLFWKIIREVRPERLITYNWGAIEWAMTNRLLTRVPHIHVEDGFGPDEAAGLLTRRILFRRLALRGRCTRVVVPSSVLQAVARQHWHIAPGSLLLVPNGIDCGRFRAVSHVARDEHVIGTVATLRREKNIERLLRVFRRLRELRPVRLVIVGGGPELERLRAVSADLGLSGSVTFTGPTSEPEAYLAGFDLFALTSDTEQMPISVLEAMASGLPLIATDVGDVRAMVAEENRSYVVAPQDEDTLVKRAVVLLDDPDRRSQIGMANRTKAERDYDLSVMLDSYRRLLSRSV